MTEPNAEPGGTANNGTDNDPSIVPDHPDDAAAGRPAKSELVTTSATDQPRAAAHNSSDIVILWPERREQASSSADAEEPFSPRSGRSGGLRRKRLGALAAVAVVAAIGGAVGGSLTTLAVSHVMTPQAIRPAPQAATADASSLLQDTVARTTADVAALRAEFDRAGKTRSAQIGKLGDRLDKMEKSQEDASARIAKIGEAQDKLQDKIQDRFRTSSAAPAAADITGSIGAAKGDSKPDARKPSIVDGWTLSRVSGGGAIVDGPEGAFEAYPGDPLPGLGRVDAVRYQDGRWVVVTPKGLIVRR